MRLLAGPASAAPAAWVRAVAASGTVALLTLASVLALGVLAAAPLGRDVLSAGVVAAFISATLGGLIAALLARAPAEVSAPASSIVVIYASLAADLVIRSGDSAANFGQIWASLSLAVVMMGLLMVLAGTFRLAEAIRFLPKPVGAGFVTGIGLVVIWSQLGPIMGLEGRLASFHLHEIAANAKPASVLVAAVTALTIWAFPRFTRRGQPALAGLAVGTGLFYLVAWNFGEAHVGPTLGRVTPGTTSVSTFQAAWGNVTWPWLLSTALHVLPYSAFLALQAIMNAAVTSATVGSIIGTRSDANRTLKAQGVANVICGCLAALPLCTAAILALPAARMKGATRTVAAESSVVLFVAVLIAGTFLSRIPIAVLASILLMGGIGMIDVWARGLARDVLRPNRRNLQSTWTLAIIAAVAAAFFLGGAQWALSVGAILAMILLAISLSAATTIGEPEAAQGSTRVWSAVQADWLLAARRTIAVFRPRGALFFGTAEQLSERLSALKPGFRYCVLDLSRLTAIDATGCQILAASAKKLDASGTTVMLAGMNAGKPADQALVALGLTFPEGPARWFADLDQALEWVEFELLKTRWPDAKVDGEFLFADTPLTTGLSGPDLAVLRSLMLEVNVQPGYLFRVGDPGSSMYVIDHGTVEIRIGRGAEEQSTRLAAFGPGSVFGEITLMTSDHRTADAVCLVPTRLLELKREALTGFEQQHPALYARLMTNLNVHLAKRLIVATRTVQSSR